MLGEFLTTRPSLQEILLSIPYNERTLDSNSKPYENIKLFSRGKYVDNYQNWYNLNLVGKHFLFFSRI